MPLNGELQSKSRPPQDHTLVRAAPTAPHRPAQRDQLAHGAHRLGPGVPPRRHPDRRRVLHTGADAEDDAAARVLVHGGEGARRRLRMAGVRRRRQALYDDAVGAREARGHRGQAVEVVGPVGDGEPGEPDVLDVAGKAGDLLDT